MSFLEAIKLLDEGKVIHIDGYGTGLYLRKNTTMIGNYSMSVEERTFFSFEEFSWDDRELPKRLLEDLTFSNPEVTILGDYVDLMKERLLKKR